jgi:L-fuconate dehydratase
MERNVLEYADHLYEHFVAPSSTNPSDRYDVPLNPDEPGCSVEVTKDGIVEYEDVR